MIKTTLTFVFLLAGCYPSWADVLINIDKTQQEMTVFVDGTEQYRWPVSTGTRGYETPEGTFQATSMNEIWYSKQWDNAPMPHAIFFTKEGHAIHGTLEVKKLGTAASHGCVRLAPENAQTLYALVEGQGLEATQVVLTGYEYQPEEPTYTEPQTGEREPGYNDMPEDVPPVDEPLYEPEWRAGPGGVVIDVPGFRMDLKFKRDRKWKRRKWRRRYD